MMGFWKLSSGFLPFVMAVCGGASDFLINNGGMKVNRKGVIGSAIRFTRWDLLVLG